MASTKKTKAFKLSFSIIWTKNDIEDVKDFFHKNGHTNKDKIKRAMSDTLLEVMQDVVADETLPITVEFREFDLDDDGYEII